MIFVLMAISVVLLIAGIFICFIFDYSEGLEVTGSLLSIFSFIGIIASIIAAIIIGVTVSSEKALNGKIEIYLEENTRLEQSVDSIVKNYLLYETDAYEQFKNDESTVLIQLFPELKANELVMKQMEIIQTNNNQIKELNSQIADLSTAKWWLYFGG